MFENEHLRAIAHHTRLLVRDVFTGTRDLPANADSPFDVFLSPEAHAINRARQEHLASLGLDLAGKRVLEVGAGIGLHTPFFMERGCEVVITDGNVQNVGEIGRRLPKMRVVCVDLEEERDLHYLGEFDFVYCYGLLYHLSEPEQAIAQLAQVCTGQLLLETIVSLGRYPEVYRIRDFVANNQATSGIGCRPTRLWVIETLRKHFGHGYITRSQPDFPDFQTNWELPETRLGYRAVFVGSKTQLQNPELLAEVPQQQARHSVTPK